METTAKVDINKLQILNDRISQTIDALNQVRMSVHGLSHSNPNVAFGNPNVGFGAWGQQNPYAQQTQAYGQAAYAQPAYAQPYAQSFGVPGFAAGLGQAGIGHSSPEAELARLQYLQAIQGFVGQNVAQGVPYGLPFGLSHSSADPIWRMRVAQTFPFAYAPIPVGLF